MKKWISLLAVLPAAWLAVMPQSTHAAAAAEEAAISDMPYITLLDSFKLYTSRDAKTGESDGALSALYRLQPGYRNGTDFYEAGGGSIPDVDFTQRGYLVFHPYMARAYVGASVMG